MNLASSFLRPAAPAVLTDKGFFDAHSASALRRALIEMVFVKLPDLLNTEPYHILEALPVRAASGVLRALINEKDPVLDPPAQQQHWVQFLQGNLQPGSRYMPHNTRDHYQSSLHQVEILIADILKDTDISSLSEDQRIDLTLAICAAPAVSSRAKKARYFAYSEILQDIPSALREYHLAHLEILRRNILDFKNPDCLQKLLDGLRDWKNLSVTQRKSLSLPLSQLIADAYDIEMPALSAEEPLHDASFEKAGEHSLAGIMYYNSAKKFILADEPFEFIRTVLHEVAGHGVEITLATCVYDKAYNRLNADMKGRHAPLDAQSWLGRASLLLVFNAEAIHPAAYYFQSEHNDVHEAYLAQPNERIAWWLETEADYYVIQPLFELYRNFYEAECYMNHLNALHDQARRMLPEQDDFNKIEQAVIFYYENRVLFSETMPDTLSIKQEGRDRAIDDYWCLLAECYDIDIDFMSALKNFPSPDLSL